MNQGTMKNAGGTGAAPFAFFPMSELVAVWEVKKLERFSETVFRFYLGILNTLFLTATYRAGFFVWEFESSCRTTRLSQNHMVIV